MIQGCVRLHHGCSNQMAASWILPVFTLSAKLWKGIAVKIDTNCYKLPLGFVCGWGLENEDLAPHFALFRPRSLEASRLPHTFPLYSHAYWCFFGSIPFTRVRVNFFPVLALYCLISPDFAQFAWNSAPWKAFAHLIGWFSATSEAF
jgi:hypothetical protein